MFSTSLLWPHGAYTAADSRSSDDAPATRQRFRSRDKLLEGSRCLFESSIVYAANCDAVHDAVEWHAYASNADVTMRVSTQDDAHKLHTVGAVC